MCALLAFSASTALAVPAPVNGEAVPAARLAQLPRVMLWAWERPERFDATDLHDFGVAYLGATVKLLGAAVLVHPRQQPLRVPPGTVLLAVVRIESDRREPPKLGAAQRSAATEAIIALSRRPGLAGVQIDFDASRSQRRFYRQLLTDVRRALPDSLVLSMTALASWALGDPWLKGLPVDEAVPMVFRMGAVDPRVRLYLARGGDFSPSLCRSSIGLVSRDSLGSRKTTPSLAHRPPDDDMNERSGHLP